MRRTFTFQARRLRAAVIPWRERCNQGDCVNRAVSYEIPMDVSVTDYDRQVRRCIDHPPPALAESLARGERCGYCDRPYWPDTMHFDCYGRDEETAQDSAPEDVAVGCQRATTEVEDG